METTYDGTQDEIFQKPYIDKEEWRDTPTRHLYVHGGFENNPTRFSFYFPPKEQYEGRFFHFCLPIVAHEDASLGRTGEEDRINFALSHGAYFVETNQGADNAGRDMIYRAAACSAQFSRKVASGLFGEHRAYGYIFGGSGGGFKTMSCVENTCHVWDGAVPFVIGSPMAIPNMFTARVRAMRILGDKLADVADASDAGGSGDIYAGLNEEERAALEEITYMGFPPRSWFAYKTMGDGALPVLIPNLEMLDPTYYEDFWTKPGYLGTDPNSDANRDRLYFTTKIDWIDIVDYRKDKDTTTTGVDDAWRNLLGSGQVEPKLYLSDLPEKKVYLEGAYVRFITGEAAGERVPLLRLENGAAVIGSPYGIGNTPNVLLKAKPGDEVILDNSDYIALQTYHRYQTPSEREYMAWEQFRDNEGMPTNPQRPCLIGPMITYGGCGSVQTGRFDCKMIVVASLMDESALPWQADWYRKKVIENLGEETDNNFRLWFNDHAFHSDTEKVEYPCHIVSYLGSLYQALLDVSKWVEKGIAPAQTTVYTMQGAQLNVPKSAKERKGIQPVVIMEANGVLRTEVHVGEKVSLKAVIDMPPEAGAIVRADWDFDGTGAFDVPADLILDKASQDHASVETTHIFTEPGTHFVTLRASSSRDGSAKDLFTQVKNLARVRVVVHR